MDQLFADHLPFIIGGLAVTAGMFAVRRQPPWAMRLAKAALMLACIYPAAIVALFLGRRHLGESYAYLIYGDLIAILLGCIAAVVLLVWIAVVTLGRKKPR